MLLVIAGGAYIHITVHYTTCSEHVVYMQRYPIDLLSVCVSADVIYPHILL